MASAAVKRRLAEDVGRWVADGLLSAEQARVLRERWDQPRLGAARVVKVIGVSGGVLAIFGIAGLIGAVSGSELVAAVLAMAIGGALLFGGVLLSIDPLARYPLSSKVVLTVGLSAFTSGVALGWAEAGVRDEMVAVGTGFVAVPLAFGLAYRFRNVYLLVLGLLAGLHWVGSWAAMMGRSTYALAIQDPRLMCVAASAVAAVGVLHGRAWRGAPPRFDDAYAAVGLTYLNLSLLILSIHAPGDAELAWILAWAAAGVGQIVIGARLHAAVFTGFGVTALAVNLFTRYAEHFWAALDAGLFFLLGGALLYGVGFLVEWRGGRAAP